MTTTDLAPKGEMVLRTLAMPADTNANGDIFGGWLMSQMDIGGAIMAKEIAQGRVVTINIEVWVKKVSSEPIGQRYKATEALFIYVAVDNQGKPRPLPAE